VIVDAPPGAVIEWTLSQNRACTRARRQWYARGRPDSRNRAATRVAGSEIHNHEQNGFFDYAPAVTDDAAARAALSVKITASETFVLTVPVGSGIADSMQFVTHLEFAGLTITTDENITGTGYTVTVGHGGNVIKTALDTLFIDQLPGKDPHNVREIWQQLYFGKSHWIGRAGATTMAQAAIDIALWDIKAKAAGLPLWQLLGGARQSDIPIYNTHAGWLNYSIDRSRMRREARRPGLPALR
jgi:hypothetical protein